MKAILLREHGGVEGFDLGEIPHPVLQKGHVIIKVCASSVNPVDCKIRGGMLAAIGPNLPGVIHSDAAGIVTEVGFGVEGLEEGDEVYGCIGGFRDVPGVLSEYALADSKLLAKKPEQKGMACFE